MVTQLRAQEGGTRIEGKFYRGGQLMPSKYRRLDERSERPKDPGSGFPDAAPNLGRSTLPHLMRFSGMIQTLSRSYRHADEAMRDSIPNAHMMLNDPMITEPLFQRLRKTSLLEWHIEVPDENDPEQKALKKELTRLVEAVPRFTDYRFDMLLAIWFGRYGIEHTYQMAKTPEGYRRYVIRNWTPVDGDKLVFRYDDGRGDYDPEQIGIRVSPALAPHDLIAGERRLEATADGLAYFLEPWEQRFWSVHKHLLIDGHWEDPITAGRIHGVGLRSFVYWLWIQKQEALAQLSEIIEMSASGIWIYWYPAGNAAAKDEVEKVASERIHTNVILMPRDVENETYGVEHIPFDGSGAQVLKELIQEMYAHLIKRLIMGQTLSSEADATGMGSGLAELQGETMGDIIKFDAKKLEETITNGLVIELRDRNFPRQRHIDVKFRIDTDPENPEKVLDAAERAWNMGAEIAELELMEKVGLTPPKPGDKVLQNPVIMQQIRLAEQHLAQGGTGAEGAGGLMDQLMASGGQPMQGEDGMPGEGEPVPGQLQLPAPEEEPEPFSAAGSQRGPEMFAKQLGLFDEEKHPRKPEGEGGGQFTGGTGTEGTGEKGGGPKSQTFKDFAAARGVTDLDPGMEVHGMLSPSGRESKRARDARLKVFGEKFRVLGEAEEEYERLVNAGDITDPSGKVVKPKVSKDDSGRITQLNRQIDDFERLIEFNVRPRATKKALEKAKAELAELTGPAKHSRPDFSYRYFRRGTYHVTPEDDGLVISQE